MTCETMEVPLDYAEPAGEMIKVFTRRVAPAAQTLEGAIVFIEGGPGLSEQGADVYGAAMLALGHSIAVYLPDRRGNGMSTYIDCPTLIPFEECVQFINTTYGWDYVQHFTVSNQARDLHAVISSTPELAENPLVYSRSYGTYLMQRYMVLFPDSLTRVVLDGVAPADLLKTPVIDLNQNFVGLELGARCGADPECASLFSRNDPVGAFYSVERALAYGDIAPACSSDLGLTARAFEGCSMSARWTAREASWAWSEESEARWARRVARWATWDCAAEERVARFDARAWMGGAMGSRVDARAFSSCLAEWKRERR